jgi:hypothetical protein
VPDGLQHTLLLAENVHRDRPETETELANTWLRPKPGAKNVEQWYGMVWVHDAARPNAPRNSLADAFGRNTRTGEDAERPYGGEATRFARPASHHADVFVAAFCDGHTRILRNDIEYRAYQQLMTPDGATAATVDDPRNHLTEFMVLPLRDSDYDD